MCLLRLLSPTKTYLPWTRQNILIFTEDTDLSWTSNITCGCTVHCFDVIWEHLYKDVENLLLWAAWGLVLSYPFQSELASPQSLRDVSVEKIYAVSKLPFLVPLIPGGRWLPQSLWRRSLEWMDWSIYCRCSSGQESIYLRIRKEPWFCCFNCIPGLYECLKTLH